MYELTEQDQYRYNYSLMGVGGDHVCPVKNFDGMPQREAVHVGDGVLIEGFVVQDEVDKRKPLLILVGVIEPSTGLPMQVDYQVKDQLEKF